MDDLKKTLESFYGVRNEQAEQQDSARFDEQGHIRIGRGDRKIEITVELINTLWQRLEQHPEVRIKGINSNIGKNEHESGPNAPSVSPSSSSMQNILQPSNKRLLATEDRMWHAIAGHAPDKSAIPPKYFDCLSVIAAHGAAGILQPHLTRLTGQQKQSVPLRTDKLAMKGYIVKKAVLAHGSKTSLLKLTRFVDVTDANEQAEMRGSRITRQPDGVACIDLDSWFDEAMSLLKAQPNFLLALQDLKIGLGISKKLEMRAILRCIRRVACVGLVRKCSAMPDDSSVRRTVMRCIQLVREPTEKDKVVWRERDRRKRSGNFGVVDESEEDEEDEEEEEDNYNAEARIANEAKDDNGVPELEGFGTDKEIEDGDITKGAGLNHGMRSQAKPRADINGKDHTQQTNDKDVGESNGSPSRLSGPLIRPIRVSPSIPRKLDIIERERAAFERWSLVTAERLIARELRHNFSSNQLKGAHMEPLGDMCTTKSTPQFSNLTISLPQQRVAQMQAKLLSRSRPGVYINPPGAKELKEMGRAGSGRPRNALIAVFKTEKLRGLDFFKDFMQPSIYYNTSRDANQSPKGHSTERNKRKLASERRGSQSQCKDTPHVHTSTPEHEITTAESFYDRSSEGQVNFVLDPSLLKWPAATAPPSPGASQSVQLSATSGSSSCEPLVSSMSAARTLSPLSQGEVNDTQLLDRAYVDAHHGENFYNVAGDVHGERSGHGPQVFRKESASESGSKTEDQSEKVATEVDATALVQISSLPPQSRIAPSATNSSGRVHPLKEHNVESAGDALEGLDREFTATASLQTTVGPASLQDEGGRVSQTTPHPSSSNSAFRSLPKKRGRPSKAMLAERERLERERNKLSRGSLMVTLKIPKLLRLFDSTQSVQKQSQEQRPQQQVDMKLVENSRKDGDTVVERNKFPLAIVRPYYEAPVKSATQNSAQPEHPSSATGVSRATNTIPMGASNSQQEKTFLQQKASENEQNRNYQPGHEIAVANYNYGATTASTTPHKRLQNRESLLQKRYSVILNLVEKCGGVCPGNREMFGPFTAAWERLYHQQPDRRTFHEALKSLVDRNKLKKITFAFRSEQGTNETGVVLALPDVETNSVQVEDLKNKIIHAYPSKYIPQEVAAPRKKHSNADAGNLTERTFGNDAILGTSANKFDRRAEFPIVEGLSVQRTKQALDLADQNAKAQGYESAKAKLNQRRRDTSAHHYNKKSSARIQPEESELVDESISADTLTHTGERRSDDDWTPRRRKRRSCSGANSRDAEIATSKKRLLPARISEESSALYALNQPGFPNRMLDWLPPQQAPGFQAAFEASTQSTPCWNIVQPKPHSLEDILEQSAGFAPRDSTLLTDALSRFECDVDQVEAWEQQLIYMNAAVSHRGDWQFINHTMYGKHIEERAAEFELDETVQCGTHGPTVDKAYVLAHPEQQWIHVGGGRWRPQNSTSLSQQRPALKVNPTLPSYTKEYVNAHPEETFYHVGRGRYRQGKPPEGFRMRKASVLVMKKTAPLHDSNYVHAHPDEIHTHVGDGCYRRVDEVDDCSSDQPSLTHTASLRTSPAILNVEKSTRSYRTRKRRTSNDVDSLDAVSELGFPTKIQPPPKNCRTTTAEKYSTLADDKDLALAIALIRLLCGGLSMNQIKWDIVSHALDFKRDGQTLKGRWTSIELKMKSWMDSALNALREPFLEAYEKNQLPTIDFLNLELTDWPTLFDWAKKEILISNNGLVKDTYSAELPRSLDELNMIYTISHHPSAVEGDKNIYFSSEAQYVRHAAVIQSVQGVPLVSNTHQTLPDQCQLDLIKSWCRAVCMTKPEDYDAETAARKIGVFSNEIINQATNELLRDQIIIAEKRDRQLPGRNFSLHRSVLKDFQRWPEAETDYLREVAAAWSTISSYFEQNETLELSQHTKDPEIVVLTNMVAQGFLKVISILPERNDDIDAAFPRFGIWGVDDIRVLHNSHNVDPSRLRFPLVYQKTASFPSEPLLKAVRVPIVPATVEGEIGARTPLWVDVNGNLLDHVWDQVLRSVLHLVVFRPGSTAGAMEKAHKGKLWSWEIALVLQWMEQVGLAVKFGAGKEEDGIWKGGWRASEWWYCAFTPEIATWETPRGRGT